MKDEYSLSPKELYQEAMNLAVTALQARQAFWNALMSLNGIIIAAAAILNASQYSSFVLLSIVLPPMGSIILVGWNFFALGRAMDMAHHIFMCSTVDQDGHMVEEPFHEETTFRISTVRKKCAVRTYCAIAITLVAFAWVIALPVIDASRIL